MKTCFKRLAPGLLLLLLTACHTDPFSIKPEVRGVKIPDRSVQDTESSAEGEKETPSEVN